MSDVLLQHEATVRSAFFAGLLVFFGVWEWWAPRRQLRASKPVRWLNNLAIVVVNTLVVRAFFPLLAVGLAAMAQAQGWGVLNQPGVVAALPGWLRVLLALLVLDLAIYLQHVMFHAVPALWRLHRMHHTDLDIDVTTGSRFHPIEIVLSMLIKMGVVLALGPAPAAVVLFEVLLNGAALFNHGNIRLPQQADRWLRLVLVTPDMHRVHHSIYAQETNSNFGFNVPWWDRLFGTYRAQPWDGHAEMTIGTTDFRAPGELWLHRLLIQPFRRGEGRYALPLRGEPAEGAGAPAGAAETPGQRGER